jgi:hypothetical protein
VDQARHNPQAKPVLHSRNAECIFAGQLFQECSVEGVSMNVNDHLSDRFEAIGFQFPERSGLAGVHRPERKLDASGVGDESSVAHRHVAHLARVMRYGSIGVKLTCYVSLIAGS